MRQVRPVSELRYVSLPVHHTDQVPLSVILVLDLLSSWVGDHDNSVLGVAGEGDILAGGTGDAGVRKGYAVPVSIGDRGKLSRAGVDHVDRAALGGQRVT